jgi:hypothetical protein
VNEPPHLFKDLSLRNTFPHLFFEIQICGGSCYFLQEPRLQRLHHILECAVLRSNWSTLPQLAFDTVSYYTVTVHIRTGDIHLHDDASAYFQRLREQLDFYLGGFKVHYVIIAEAPDKGDSPAFDFIGDIFVNKPPRVKVSHLNQMTALESLFHMMNADMLVTTGSSFPYIAVAVSPKVSYYV